MIIIQFIPLIWLIVAVLYMSSVLKKNFVDCPLTLQERLVVICTSIFSPVISGAIYYYGWKQKLPTKAKQANTISLVVVFLGLVGFLTYFLYQGNVL